MKKMRKIEFKPVTGLDIAKLLGPKAVEDYLRSCQIQEEKKARMEKNLQETKDWFKKLNQK